MADKYRNLGPAIEAETMRDANISSYYARELHVNQQTTTTIHNNGIVLSTVQPRTISFNNIPEPHGSFTGRIDYIESVIKYLSHPVAADVQIQFPCLIIHALGGYGKTQTARKIVSVCRNKRKFQHFIWIDSEDVPSIKKCFVAVMIQVGLPASQEGDDTKFDSLMHQFYNLLACRKKEKFLIIFDNVEDFDNILKFLPLNHRASNFAVLMTSQRPFTRESYGHVRNQPLDLMLEKEAMQLVNNILGTSTMDSEEDKKLLVKRSGRIALVLCVMASTIKYERKCRVNCRIKDYLKEMCEQPIQYCDESNYLDLTYGKSFQNIVRFAVNKLNAADGPMERIAVKVFDRLAYCSSTNKLRDTFVRRYFRDICEKAKSLDMKLPIKPIDDVQIIRMAIEKLSEFSLAQIDGDELIVHRWNQLSRRLDLKASGDERNVVKELIFIMPDFDFEDDNTPIIWQYVVDDYPDLVNEFYAKKRTLMKFPISNVDVLEKIIRGLTQSVDFEPLGNYSEEIEEIICRHCYSSDSVKRIVNLFNYEVSRNPSNVILWAIQYDNVDLVEWLFNEKECRPEEYHLQECLDSLEMHFFWIHLLNLKQIDFEIIKNSSSMNPFKRVFNVFQRLFVPYDEWNETIRELSYQLSSFADSDPLKIQLCNGIEKNYGKDGLNVILRCDANKDTWHDRKIFAIIRVILSALKKLEPSIELDDISQKYSGKCMVECLFICGQTHYIKKKKKLKRSLKEMKELNWNDLQRAAYENIITIDPTLIDFKDDCGDTPLCVAARSGAYEATTVLLEKYSANVNCMNRFGETPLGEAIDYSHPSILKTLLSHGAKTHWKTESGLSVNALHQTIKSLRYLDISEEIVDALLTAKDCNVRATDDDGNTILHMLVCHYYATTFKPNHRLLQLILSADATLVNMQNNNGFTPLQLAKNLQAKFDDDHWHVASLQSFISEINCL